MCVYSMMADVWRTPGNPNYIPLPSVSPASPITAEIAKLMLEILKKADELDKKVGLVDCKLNKIEKAAYQEELRRIAKAKCPCKTAKKKRRKAKVSGQAFLDRVPSGRKKQLLQE